MAAKMDAFLGWLMRLGDEISAEYIANLIFSGSHKSEDISLIQRARDLFKSGKEAEAYEVLKARPGGWGLADEQILLTDIIALVHGDKITRVEGLFLSRFLSECTPWQRQRIREGHAKEDNPVFRRRNLIELARCQTHDEMVAFITASGLWDLNAFERAVTEANAWAEDVLAGIEERNARKVERNAQPITIATIFNLPTRHSVTTAWQAGRGNFLAHYGLRTLTGVAFVISVWFFWAWAVAR